MIEFFFYNLTKQYFSIYFEINKNIYNKILFKNLYC